MSESPARRRLTVCNRQSPSPDASARRPWPAPDANASAVRRRRAARGIAWHGGALPCYGAAAAAPPAAEACRGVPRCHGGAMRVCARAGGYDARLSRPSGPVLTSSLKGGKPAPLVLRDWLTGM